MYGTRSFERGESLLFPVHCQQLKTSTLPVCEFKVAYGGSAMPVTRSRDLMFNPVRQGVTR